MTKLLTVYRKACVVAAASAGIITAAVADGHVTLAEGVAIALSVLAVPGVAAVTNTDPSQPRPPKGA